jgi:hypothetical protein
MRLETFIIAVDQIFLNRPFDVIASIEGSGSGQEKKHAVGA